MWWVWSSGAKSAGTLKRPQQLSSSLPQTHNQTCSEQIIRHSNRQWQAYTKIRHAVNRYQIHIQTYSDQKHKIRHTVNTNMQPYKQWQAYTKIRRKAGKSKVENKCFILVTMVLSNLFEDRTKQENSWVPSKINQNVNYNCCFWNTLFFESFS